MDENIFKAVKILSRLPVSLLRFLRIAFISLGLVGLVGGFIIKLLNLSGIGSANLMLGLGLIFLPLGLSLGIFEIYITLRLKEPPLNQSPSPFAYFDFETAKVIDKAALLAQLRDREVQTTDLVWSLATSKEARAIWFRLAIDPKNLISEEVINNAGTVPLRHEMSYSVQFSSAALGLIQELISLRTQHNEDRVGIPDLLIALFDNDQSLQTSLLQNDINRDDLLAVGLWFESNRDFVRHWKRFWERDNLLRRSPIGKDWAYGHTPRLNQFTIDLTNIFEDSRQQVQLVGRKETIDEMERVLSRAGESNVLLVGEHGVGKKTIIDGLVQKIANGSTLPDLKYKRVLEARIDELLTSGQNDKVVIDLLRRGLIEAAKAGNIVLVINNIHNYLGVAAGVGRIDLTELLTPYFMANNFQVIGTTDAANFHKFLEPRSDIMRMFEKIDVPQPDKESTIKILQAVLPHIEQQEKVFVTYPALKDTVERAEQFIPDLPFPEKAIKLLSEVGAAVRARGGSVVLTKDVDKVVSQKTHVPLGTINESEKDKINNLDKYLHEDIVNQQQAITRLAETMLRLRAGVGRGSRPAGVFLFTGPTGVGKTQTAKALAKVYFGSEDKMIRFDMSEFQTLESIDRFIGSAATGEPGQFANKLRESPFAVILLDEFEKANSKLLNLFLQVFDEGRLTDVFGRTLSLKECIIIATSNAGSEYIRELLVQNVDPSAQPQMLIEYLLSNNIFAPELINRFDEVVIYHPLTREQIRQVAAMLLDKYAKRLKADNFYFEPNEQLIDYLAINGFDEQFGVRPMQRLIQNTVEVLVSKKIINQEIKKGESFTVSVSEITTQQQTSA